MEVLANSRDRELFVQWKLQSNTDVLLLFAVTINRDFRKDVDEIRKVHNINVGSLLQGLKKKCYSKELIFHVLEFSNKGIFDEGVPEGSTYDIDSFGNIIRLEKLATSNFLSIKDEYIKLQEYEAKYLPDDVLEALLHDYHLDFRYLRRVKSIILYNDYPDIEDVMPPSTAENVGSEYIDEDWVSDLKKFNKEMDSLKKRKIYISTDEKNQYIELKIFGDTNIDILKTKEFRKQLKEIQTSLSGYRKTLFDKRSNLLRDAYSYFLTEYKNMSHEEAFEIIKQYSNVFVPYTSWGPGSSDFSQAKLRFSRFAKDILSNKKKN